MVSKSLIKKFFISDEILGEIARNKPLPSLNIYGKKGAYFALIESIISQQLSPIASNKIFLRFEDLVKNQKNVPHYVSKLKTEDLRKIGISSSKGKSIIEVSKMVYAKKLNFDEIRSLNDEEIEEILLKINGIGLWTCFMFLMFGLKREDVWPYNDYGIRKKLALLLGKSEILSFEETRSVGERWIPYRSYASCYIWGI